MSCSSAMLSTLKPEGLVDFLTKNDYDCVWNALSEYNNDVINVLSKGHVIKVLNAIADRSPAYQGDDRQHLRELLHFVYVAYYFRHWYVNTVLFDPKDNDVKQEALSALDAFIVSSHANDNTPDAARILYEWIIAVEEASLLTGSFAQHYSKDLKSVLGVFRADHVRRGDDYWQQKNIKEVFYFIRQEVDAFPPAIDQEMTTVIRRIALLQDLPPSAASLIDNAVCTLGTICQIPALHDAAVDAITETCDTYTPFAPRSPPYLWAIAALDKFNNCLDAHGRKVCKKDVVPQLEAALFPNVYEFDDGAIHMRTPLPLDRVQVLYHAIKQVESQFNRITETIAPLQGDTNPMLRVDLYGSPDDYRLYHRWLTGLDTDNGGIYIEEKGIFYTYDRTPNESVYTLEELFRHEYSHYLIGRFLIAGRPGTALIYDNERMTWFDEGFAEFLTGSTSCDGVNVRKILVDRIIREDGSNRNAVAQVLSATYDNFKFYRYAGLLFSYWNEHDIGTLRKLIDLARRGSDPNYLKEFDALVNNLRNDAQLESDYQGYLDGLIANVAELENPHTEFPPVDSLDLDNPELIQMVVRKTRVGYLATCSVAAGKVNPRFSCRGCLAGSIVESPDHSAAWHLFDAGLNELLNDLRQSAFNNFQGANARFGQIRFITDANNKSYPLADFFMDGPLGPGNNTLLAPVDQVALDFHSTRLGVSAVCKLSAPNMVECRLALTTRLYPQSTSTAVLRSELDNDIVELRNQVYAIRPPYYRDFRCEFYGPEKLIASGVQQKYLLRSVLCHVRIS